MKNRGIWKIIDVFGLDAPREIYGIALDLGSTTLVLQLVNLIDGSILDEVSFHNPQIRIGSDILTRIHYATAKGGLAELQEMVIQQINHAIDQITEKHAIKKESIVAMSVAGNTTMTHFFPGPGSLRHLSRTVHSRDKPPGPDPSRRTGTGRQPRCSGPDFPQCGKLFRGRPHCGHPFLGHHPSGGDLFFGGCGHQCGSGYRQQGLAYGLRGRRGSRP